MNKQSISVLTILIIFMILLQARDKTSNASLEDVAQSVAGAIDLEGMEESTNQMFRKFYGLNAGDYEGVTLYAPASNMNAEELLVIKLQDSSQADSVTQAINSRLETQMNRFEGYGVEQYDMLENHVLDVQGNFILYIVHPDAEKADQAFRSSL